MNIVVLDRSDWRDEEHVCLVDRRADHIRAVLRAAVGDSVRVGELNGYLRNKACINPNCKLLNRSRGYLKAKVFVRRLGAQDPSIL